MNMTFIPFHLIVALIVFGLVGCGKSPETKQSDAPSASQPTIAKPKPVSLPSVPPPTPMKSDEPPLPSITELSPKVSGVRTGDHGRDAVVAMHQLLQQWTPVGKPVTEVKSMLGTPSEENATQLVYRFDDGDQASEWTMPVANGAIASLSKVLHE